MFLIVPKSRQQVEVSRDTDSGQNSAHATNSSSKHLRGPTRVQSACDECRARKIKLSVLTTAQCNGQNPCGRCRARNIVCVFNFAEAKKRLKGPLTSAQASTLEAQQARLVGAIKRMSSRIQDLEASLSAKQHNETDDDNVGGSDAQPKYVSQDEDFDLNAVLDRYAPPRKVNEPLPSSRESDQLASNNKRRRTNQSTIPPTQSTRLQLDDSAGSPSASDYTAHASPTHLHSGTGFLANELGTTHATSLPNDQMVAPWAAASPVSFQLAAEPAGNSLDSLQYTIESGDGGMLPMSIEELYVQCQNMDALMESIDWETSRTLSASLLRES
ncbi:hypothetical protein E4T47_05735 [Aureobasidium subglaciale]|nr:hypothetical protein E4T43_02080 [Aureobasidium subglaciale]KAI5270971.1 hypothetical protein E4T47_05735 [Aureobasidium subglaciale]